MTDRIACCSSAFNATRLHDELHPVWSLKHKAYVITQPQPLKSFQATSPSLLPSIELFSNKPSVSKSTLILGHDRKIFREISVVSFKTKKNSQGFNFLFKRTITEDSIDYFKALKVNWLRNVSLMWLNTCWHMKLIFRATKGEIRGIYTQIIKMKKFDAKILNFNYRRADRKC